MLGLLPVLPETPRWLVMRDRIDEAKKVLNKIYTPEEAHLELERICKQHDVDRTLPSSYMSMVTRKSYRKSTLLALGTTCGIQFSGILVINNYQPTLYGVLGFPTAQQLLLEGGWITLAWGSGIMGCFIIDRLPRPKLIAGALGGCMICLIIVAALIANFVPSDNENALNAIVAMIFVYVIFYEGGLDGTQFAYLGELFPTHLRAKGMNVGVAGICLMNIVWLQSAPTGIANAGWKYFLAYIIPGCLTVIGIWMYFPDTWGVPLEEIAEMFGDAEELKVEPVIDSEQATLAEREDKTGQGIDEEDLSSRHKEVAYRLDSSARSIGDTN